MMVLIPTICFVCGRSRTLGDKGSSATCLPSLFRSFWCFFDFSTSVRWMCFTTMSIATRFSMPRGTMMSACAGVSFINRTLLRLRHTCHLSLRLYVAPEIRLDVGKPLLDTSFYISSSLSDISGNLLFLSISYQAIKATLWVKDILLRARHRSASASAKIFMSSSSKTRGSYNANIPSRISTWGE